MPIIKLSEEDIDNICISLNIRNNYIQTGTAHISPETLKKMGKHNKGIELKPLNTDQMILVIKQTQLIQRLRLS